VTSVTVDDDGDLTYGLTLAANTDYWLEPLQGFPDPGIYNRIVIAPRSSQAFSPGYRVKVIGDWGYVVGGLAPAIGGGGVPAASGQALQPARQPVRHPAEHGPDDVRAAVEGG
jgi:hypothetical protein